LQQQQQLVIVSFVVVTRPRPSWIPLIWLVELWLAAIAIAAAK